MLARSRTENAMRTITLVLVAVVALAAGAILGPKVLRTDSADDEPSERLEQAEARAKQLSAQVEQLTQELDKAHAKLAAAGLAAAPRTTVPAAPPAPGADAAMADAASEKPDAGRRIVVPGYEDVVETVDWGRVGTGLRDLPPIVQELTEEWPKTKVLPRATSRKLAVINAGNLVPAALAAASKLKYEVPQSNSAFTHPSFVVNAIAATLEAAEKPLEKEQADALAKI